MRYPAHHPPGLQRVGLAKENLGRLKPLQRFEAERPKDLFKSRLQPS